MSDEKEKSQCSPWLPVGGVDDPFERKPGWPGEIYPVPKEGILLRDWFAGQALMSIAIHSIKENEPPSGIAAVCYMIADAMLEVRKR